MDEPVGVGVWRKKDRSGNWISEKSEFDPEASKRRADHLDHFLKLPSFQQRYELEVKSRDSVRDARQCAGAATLTPSLTRTFIKHSRTHARARECTASAHAFGCRRCGQHGVESARGRRSRVRNEQSHVCERAAVTRPLRVPPPCIAPSRADNKGLRGAGMAVRCVRGNGFSFHERQRLVCW